MARRRKPFGSQWLQQSLNAMTRTALRAGNLAFRQALRHAKAAPKLALPKPVSLKPKLPARRRPKPARGPLAALQLAVPKRKAAKRAPSPRTATKRRTAKAPGWTSGVAIGPAGVRRYHLYKPPGIGRRAPVPLLVMLHGCGQDAAELATTSRMNRVAAAERFLVLYPEQDRLSNAQGCWNWFDTRSGRAQGEAAIIDAAIEQVCLTQPVDRSRIAIAGLSAGAGMAALLATRRPQRFRAVAMHSGIAPGLAHSSATALSAMRGRRKAMLPLPPAASATNWPALLVIQGSADRVVAAANGDEAVRQWAAHSRAVAATPRVVQRGARRAATITDYRSAGRIAATLCLVEGLGHAWSGGAANQPYSDPRGPDATRMIWRFCARAFARAAPA